MPKQCLYEIVKGVRCSRDRDEDDNEYCETHRTLACILKEQVIIWCKAHPPAEFGRMMKGMEVSSDDYG